MNDHNSSIRFRAVLLAALTAMILSACYPVLREPAPHPEEALRRVRFFLPEFADDMDPGSLDMAIERNLEYLGGLAPDTVFHYGADAFTCRQVLRGQEAFLALIRKNPGPRRLKREIRGRFRVYRATGRVGNNKVLFTGYYAPVFDASLTPGGQFRYPVYRRPDDLVSIDLSLFSKRFKGERIMARLEGKKVVPYYSRHGIDRDKALAGRHLEIAWLRDPVDVAFLHIQGSGRLRLPDGRLIRVGFDEKNGRPYRSIGRYLIEKGLLTREGMSMQAIRETLVRHPDMVEEVLNYNPSYVFFRILKGPPLGNLGIPVTPGRSLALDARIFPKGALGFMICRKPVVDGRGRITGWKPFSRFVLNQDTGGAIRGAGRADLFWGSGTYAEIAAGHMKHDGTLYLMVLAGRRQ